MDFTQLFRGISRKMLSDFQYITSQIPHMGDRGSNREEVIKTFLKKHLPGKYDIGSGQAISADGQISKQLDCVIYAKATCPLWYNESTQIFPAESVCAVTEIKSTLDKSVLEMCVENIRSVRKLPKLGGSRPLASGISVGSSNPLTLGSVFAYSSSVSLDTLRDNLNILNKDLPPTERISLVCILDKGILLNMNVAENRVILLPEANTTMVSIKTEQDSLLLFFLLLSSYLNQIEVIPPDLIKYAATFMNNFRWETRPV
ncbi:DUF6602 domain-containing protein [Aeribacillus composti]|uniref:DUF6602 domain-containing protein n=1 Tax=Aeribacillus composti TaxID=1868734 RepID=UPI00406A75AE